ncbi:type II secretion system protein [Lacticaseibacillus sharpeae]|uniref:Prepilin-type N-terminal cleavage/methylation domain-containing protein n=1 Tax=Lacticaseibacillus sharpeae JCM 1186 = DSM 20505 TaxID=1291052 RepID=A0A0R1ZK63_9LACO|nr:type II secretion system protein [Lacticaseibacillus sharpeae]KRM54746.1 hypothetical protein FC18_GL002160 [Lacticaseibacillus sharpeae JCM 1186 = DSM 20505]
MRRRGFTLIEVLAALVVITVTLMLGVVVGRKWVQEQREMAFCQRVVTEWNAMMVNAENSKDNYTMEFKQASKQPCTANFMHDLPNGEHVISVIAPLSLQIMNNSSFTVRRKTGQNFTQPLTIMIESQSGAVYKMVLELGWGRLKLLKNGVLVE